MSDAADMYEVSAPRSSRGNRNRKNGPVSREVQVSKKLSWLLRHGAEKEGLALGRGGYASLADVLQNRTLRGMHISLDEVKQLVASNDKQRFALAHVSSDNALDCPDTDLTQYLIRANQGHSLKIDDEGLLTPLSLESASLPRVVVHGTRHDAWQAIRASGGLRPMRRQHVHFATGLPHEIEAARNTESVDSSAAAEPDAGVAALGPKDDAPQVRSGMRVTSTILMFLDLRKALESGLKFLISDNGVVLSDGGERGLVPLDFFERIEEKGGRLLWSDGLEVAEATFRKQKR